MRASLSRLCGLAVVAIMLSGRDAVAAPDLSTPKAAAVSVAKAISAGDVELALQCVSGTDEERTTVESLAMSMKSLRAFIAAVDERYGKGSKLAEQMRSYLAEDEVVGDTERAEFKETGDTAVMVDPKRPLASNPMRLKRIGGVWKADLSNTSARTKLQGRQSRVLATVLDEVREGVKAGKYETPDAAHAAFKEKVTAAIKAM